jgi:molybdopterin converting factor subunit 1
MKVLYFAWLKTKTGVGEQEIDPPAGVSTVGDLVHYLATLSDGHKDAFANTEVVKAAVNLEFVGMDYPIAANDEIAFFPPVTGG